VLVGTSTTFTATDFSIQRKTFEYGGRDWAFWDDGSNVVYASSQFGYAQGQNTLTWTAKMSTGSGTVGKGFDVSQAGGTVLLGYVNSGLTTMSVLIGTISGTVITWYGPYLIDDWGSAQYPEAPIVGAGVPTVAIGTDGYLWVGYVFGFQYIPTGTNYYLVQVHRSSDPGSSNFVWSATDYVTGPASLTSVRLVALSNGTLVSIMATSGNSMVNTRRYGAAGWGSTLTWDIKLPSTGERGSLLSAVGDAKDNVHIVFAGDSTNAPGIRYTVLHPDDTLSPNPSQQVDSTTGTDQPTVAHDANGDVHLFWRYTDSSSYYYIRYARQLPSSGSWSPISEPWGRIQYSARLGLTAGISATNAMFLLWTLGSSGWQVQFGAVATPMNVGSQTGQPWDRQGLSPYQS